MKKIYRFFKEASNGFVLPKEKSIYVDTPIPALFKMI
jgi:hypothetical protein